MKSQEQISGAITDVIRRMLHATALIMVEVSEMIVELASKK